MKIQLVKAPSENTGMPEHCWYPPLNLIWLANYLQPHGYDVEILDGQVLGLRGIIDRISSGLLGVSFDILSIDAFDTILREGKKRGCFTVAGGHLATALGSQLMRENEDLDVVVKYDGEEAILGIANRIARRLGVDKTVPNVVCRYKDSIYEGPISDVDLKSLPLPRRDIPGIDLEVYISEFQRTKSTLDLQVEYTRPTNAYSHKGCPFRTGGRGCSFCSRVDQRFREKSAAQVYAEYRYLWQECQIDHISDFSDSWISTSMLRRLYNLYEANGQIGSSLRVYGDVRLVTAENASIMRELGVDTVLLGIESGNERVLRQNGKPTTRQQILAAVSLLSANQIKVADAYVLGLIGETRESLMDTVALAREIRTICETEITYCNIMTPLPGSQVWNCLLDKGLIDETIGYHWNPIELEKLAIDNLCELGQGGYDVIVEARERLLQGSKVSSAEFVSRSVSPVTLQDHGQLTTRNDHIDLQVDSQVMQEGRM